MTTESFPEPKPYRQPPNSNERIDFNARDLELPYEEDPELMSLLITELSHKYLGDIEDFESEREFVIQRIASGEIEDDDAGKFIAKIPNPVIDLISVGNQEINDLSPINKVTASINDSIELRQIIQSLTGRLDKKIIAADIAKFLDKFETVKDFEEKLELKRYKNPSMVLEMASQEEIDELENILYGGQAKVWRQWKLLKEEAGYVYKNLDKGLKLGSLDENQQKNIIQNEERKNVRDNLEEEVKVSELDALESEAILSRTEIHGDPFLSRELTPEILKSNGLAPRFKVEIGNKAIWFSSNPYHLGEKRIATIAYVEKGGQVVARSYYRSNSQGIWRYLPEYLMVGEGLAWYSKGFGEQSITLPIAYQKILAELSFEEDNIIDVSDPELIFAGTAREMNQRYQNEMISFANEVESLPQEIDGNFILKDKRREGKIPPREQKFSNPEDMPDFSKVKSSWVQKTSIYGDVEIKVFDSKNGKYHYMFCEDRLGRVWIGGIENDSEILSTGLRNKWIDGHDLMTPAYEYDSQSDGYGNYDLREGRYVDMYKYYLSKMPIIEEYLKHNKK